MIFPQNPFRTMAMLDLIKSIQSRDPARPTTGEVILAYPGFHVLGFHALASTLWRYNLRALGRFVSHLGRMFTGIEIHPGAKIGKNLFIDHGMGTVIGETAVIGDNVTLYQNVTLGGRGNMVEGKRHPTLKNGVMVGAGAIVLGDITIGENARIGANAIVTKNIEDGATAINETPAVKNYGVCECSYGLPAGDI